MQKAHDTHCVRVQAEPGVCFSMMLHQDAQSPAGADAAATGDAEATGEAISSGRAGSSTIPAALSPEQKSQAVHASVSSFDLVGGTSLSPSFRHARPS